ncbi:MAG: hypothetical protein HYR72_26815 [Deltaproteobacteria bacterium]|nr:hypothetical protein [Deltaproteobacteria bacterium]
MNQPHEISSVARGYMRQSGTGARIAAKPKALCLLVLAPLLAGCPVNARLTTGYRTTATALRPAPIDASLAVQRFDDKRPPRLYSTQGRALIALVPLVPYVSLPFERIDETAKLQSEDGAQPTAPDFEQYTYPASFARTIADDLGASGLFKAVVYTGQNGAAGYRYVLDGTLLESPLVHSKTCFLLGLPTCYIDFLGVPSIKTTARVKLQLRLQDTVSGVSIWNETIEGQASEIYNDAYSSPILYGPSVFSFVTTIPPADWPVDDRSIFAFHFEALRRAMVEAKPDLAAALTGR